LFLKIETTVDKFLSHRAGYIFGKIKLFFFKPFEKTVIRPKLFLPAKFLINTLKILFKFLNRSKYIDFLNL
jgi:hypothetical protein